MSLAAKICGLNSEAAVAAAVDGGAAYLGFVFYPPSPRAVTPAQAARLCAAVPAGIARVGLFVDADDAMIGAVLAEVPLDILQFHGAETPRRVAAAQLRFGRRVMKAVPIAGPEDVAVPHPTKRSRICCCSTPSRRTGRMRCRAATAWLSTGS